MGHSLGQIFRNYIVPAALTVGGFAVGGPAGAAGANALYAGARTANNSGNVGQILKSGAIAGGGAYLGSGGTVGGYGLGSLTGNAANISSGSSVGSVLGNTANSIGGAGTSNAIGSALGSTVTNALSSTPTSALAGSFAGNTFAQSLNPQTAQVNQTPQGFVPKQQDAQGLPSSLKGFGGLDSGQQESNLANQGTYGGGLGPQENSYFLNLINRHLVDQSGKTSSASSLSPISQSYLQKLGFGGYGNNTNSLLEAISKWKAA